MSHDLTCTCGAVGLRLTGQPRVRGHCHCNACRTLLGTPYHSVTAWDSDQASVTRGREMLVEAQHPALKMKKVFCRACGDVLYNTNAMGWRVVSQHLIARSLGALPEELSAQSHFFYDSRIVTIDDDLPKKA
ncbi:GFA family protein [Marinibacterium sp. SX1]|uniref:GFA family protein n=1 Tax=Marinibacterium sp. SX1 TaxID=3388424 RepID=UPI003D17612A